MSYVKVDTNKFYYGSTIIILGYKHEKYGYKFTTVSSSYTIDDDIVLGLGTNSDAYKQIKKYNNFSVNIIGQSNKRLIEAGAQNPGGDRFNLNKNINYTIDEEYNIPLIGEVLGQFICTRTEDFILKTNPSFINVAATIQKRLFSDEVLFDGKVQKHKLDTVLFFSDINGEYIK